VGKSRYFPLCCEPSSNRYIIFPQLFKTEKDQFILRRLSTKLSDLALDITLSLDCLNDLQLVLQYENFIVHTHVDGDQSKKFSLGFVCKAHSSSRIQAIIRGVDLETLCHRCLHLATMRMYEKTKPPVPNFLAELRKTAWATTYSADKNVAIFLGRPPRMSKRFCHFQVPLTPTSSDQVWNTSQVEDKVIRWKTDTPICYMSSIRWATLCAALKEDVLELLRSKQRENFSRKAR
jgi:hypothetical protein